MIFRIIFIFISYILFVTNSSAQVFERSNVLFEFDPAVKSKQEAIMPISQSLEEWNIALDVSLVDLDSDQFEIKLPNTKKNDSSYRVNRTSFYSYDSGVTQWKGDVLERNIGDNSQASRFDKSGYVIINVIDGKPFGTVQVNGVGYEIYTDSNVGTRLARVSTSTKEVLNIHTNKSNSDLYQLSPKSTNLISPEKNNQIPGTSIIDVLVVIEDDLLANQNEIEAKIINEWVNANGILADSGPNGIGVPVRINLLPYQYIDIPPQYHSITMSDASYDYLGNDVSTESQLLKQMLINSGADFLALYVDFDPDILGTDVCGRAEISTNQFDDLFEYFFRTSFSMHASHCGLSQYVFLHELMHNFGSAHFYQPGNPLVFEDYSNGYNVLDSDIGPFSTLMNCTPLGGDPSEETCTRSPQLSSPLAIINGSVIGDQNADNVRFLTECEPNNGPCRRGQIANKGSNSNPVDLLPILNFLSPTNGDSIPAGNQNVSLSASASDDNGIVMATWTITDVTTSTPIQVDYEELTTSGTNPNINYSTAALNNIGDYIITISVKDTLDQISTKSHTVSVTDGTDVSMSVSQAVINNNINVKAQNLGPIDATNVVFKTRLTIPAGAGARADLINVPTECTKVPKAILPSINFEIEYICNITALSLTNSIFELEWQRTNSLGGSMTFEAELISINEVDINPNNNSSSLTIDGAVEI